MATSEIKTDELRCRQCGKKLGENLKGHLEVVCPRCKRFNVFNNGKIFDKKPEVC